MEKGGEDTRATSDSRASVDFSVTAELGAGKIGCRVSNRELNWETPPLTHIFSSNIEKNGVPSNLDVSNRELNWGPPALTHILSSNIKKNGVPSNLGPHRNPDAT